MPRQHRNVLVASLSLFGLLAFGGAFTPVAAQKLESPHSHEIPENIRAEATKYMEYHRSIDLTPEQEAIKARALKAIRAPCCSKFSMATCCCPCNLARSVWGLSNYLIAERGSDSAQVKTAVEDWIKAINPAGFTGDACFSGGCNRPFHENGCGGMHARKLM